eukprot:TRINITY_DN1957_c0_g3_i2.p1 TRINITY_DN1957_c0_g3~~TRINITY_DN1957_c0_g3_i2.p1  ORF type:complete len:168 (-),score=51.24 TRINITY_DN1957_c0_g3_i2:44-547(-)
MTKQLESDRITLKAIHDKILNQISRLQVEELSLKKMFPHGSNFIPIEQSEIDRLCRKYEGIEDHPNSLQGAFAGVLAELAIIDNRVNEVEVQQLSENIKSEQNGSSSKLNEEMHENGVHQENEGVEDDDVESDDEASVRMRNILAAELGQNYDGLGYEENDQQGEDG